MLFPLVAHHHRSNHQTAKVRTICTPLRNNLQQFPASFLRKSYKQEDKIYILKEIQNVRFRVKNTFRFLDYFEYSALTPFFFSQLFWNITSLYWKGAKQHPEHETEAHSTIQLVCMLTALKWHCHLLNDTHGWAALLHPIHPSI